MFVGSVLEDVVKSIISGEEYIDKVTAASGIVGTIAYTKDDTDRNRTSPFAFTGNKFEFRMVGSDMSVAGANLVLNTIVAEELGAIADKLEAVGVDKLDEVLKEIFVKHGRIIFNGNNYSAEWKEEAAKRGLVNMVTTVDAIPAYVSEKNVALFEKHGVMTAAELHSRYEILTERYIKVVDIEARTMLNIANREIIPACIGFQKEVLEELTIKSALAANYPGLCPKAEAELAEKLAVTTCKAAAAAKKLAADLEKAAAMNEGYECAVFHKEEILADMKALRAECDVLEEVTDKKVWPFPTYSDLLNSVKY